MLVSTVSQQYMSQVPGAQSHFIKLTQAHVSVRTRKGLCVYMLIKCLDSSCLTHKVRTFQGFGHEPASLEEKPTVNFN